MLKNFFWIDKQPADEREAVFFAEAQTRSMRVSMLALFGLVVVVSRLPQSTVIPIWTLFLTPTIYILISCAAGYTVIRKHDMVLKTPRRTISREGWAWILTIGMTGLIQPTLPVLFYVGSGILAVMLLELLRQSKKSSYEDFFGHALLTIALFVAYVALGILVTSPSLL